MNRGKAVVGTGEASRKQGSCTRCQGSDNPPPGLAALAASGRWSPGRMFERGLMSLGAVSS